MKDLVLIKQIIGGFYDKKDINKLLPKYFPTSESLISALRKEGANIGEGVYIFGVSKCVIDRTRPWLLTIGDYTVLTQGVIILTHDYSLSTLRRVYGEWIGEGKETSIGKNCFVGMNSIILMGTHIGDNVIVGAGSVVHGNIPDNVVVAGNPAKVICTLEEHYKRRSEKTKEEALFCAKQYYRRMNKIPSPSDLGGFKFLFAKRDRQYLLDS